MQKQGKLKNVSSRARIKSSQTMRHEFRTCSPYNTIDHAVAGHVATHPRSLTPLQDVESLQMTPMPWHISGSRGIERHWASLFLCRPLECNNLIIDVSCLRLVGTHSFLWHWEQVGPQCLPWWHVPVLVRWTAGPAMVACASVSEVGPLCLLMVPVLVLLWWCQC